MRRLNPTAVALSVCAVGLALASWLALHRRADNVRLAHARLAALAERDAERVASRLEVFRSGLRGARGALIGAGLDGITRTRFAEYVRSRDLAREFHGALGFGFVRFVARAEEAPFVAAARADGLPTFALHERTPHEGDHYVVQYVEPLAPSAPAVGLDLASEPVRRAGAELARATGRATLTGPIELLSSSTVPQLGFLMLLPVYRGIQSPHRDGVPTPLFGWVYAPLVAHDVLDDLDLAELETSLGVSDVTEPGRPVVVYRPTSPARGDLAPLVVRKTLSLFGRRWLLETHARTSLVTNLRLRSPWYDGGLLAASFAALAGLSYLFLISLRREFQLAEERVRAADALREQDARFRALSEALPHLVWTCDEDGACDYLSPQWERYTGTKASEQLGTDWLKVLHPDDLPFVRRAWAEATARGDVFDVEFRIRRHDGVYRWFKARARGVRDASGRVLRWYGSNTDIQDLRDAQDALASINTDLESHVLQRTEALRAANEELRQLSERLKLATEAAHMGVWDRRLDTGEMHWDDALRALYGFGPDEEASFERFRASVHPDDLDAVVQSERAARQGGDHLATTFRIVRPDGEVRHLRAFARLDRDESGRLTRMVGVNLDVTEQRVAELSLRESEALQRGILAHAGSSIIACRPDGTISLFNHAAERLLGYRADEMVGTCTPAVFHDPDEVAARRRVLEAQLETPLDDPFEVFVALSRRTGQADTNEWTYVAKDGRRIPVLLTVTTLRDETGGLVGYLGVGLDLSVQKRQARELTELNALLTERSAQAESASRAKSLFLATMSHEMRTPMNAITGTAYLLSRTVLDDEQRLFLDRMQRASRALLDMINDVLDLGKIEAGQFTLEVAPFRLHAMLDDVASILAGYAAGKDLTIERALPDDLPAWLSGDAVRLQQVLTNLAGNAVKFTERGRVCVRVTVLHADAHATRLRFEVEDTGPGIAADDLPRLFAPFTQGKGPHTARAGGTGLGLAIVKQLTELMGGTVGVASELGVGSRFWCDIPFELPPPETRIVAHEGHDPALPRLLAMRVLVVDDSQVNREIVQSILEHEGALVSAARDGEQAVTAVTSSDPPFDVVLMDVQMPVLDGIAATRILRTTERGARLPVIALTAGALATDRQDALAAGMNDVVTKPFVPDALIACVVRHVARARGTPSRVGALPRDAGAPFPELPGIDAREAQLRLRGDFALFRRLLRLLVDEFGPLTATLPEARPESRRALLAPLHKLRGAAANLGALELARAAGAAEGLLTRSAELDGVLDRIVRELGRLRASAAALDDAAPQLPAHERSDAPPLDAAELTLLRQRLHERDLAALDLARKLGPPLAGALGAERFQALRAALERLDFAAALEALTGS